MSTAHQIVEAVLKPHVVVWVYEVGTADPFYALYIDDRLISTSPRAGIADVLEALGIKPQTVYVAKGFDGNFPERLSALKTQFVKYKI